MDELISRKKLNAAPTFSSSLGSFQRVLFLSSSCRPRVDVTLGSVSCFTLWDILSSLGLNNACGKNSENVPLRNENNVARSFSDHFPGHYSVEREEA